MPISSQAGTLLADDDALLAVALDVDVDAYVDQRLVLGAVGARNHLVDDDGDRVRELVAHAFQRGLADDLRDQRLLGLVGQLPFGVERRALRQRAISRSASRSTWSPATADTGMISATPCPVELREPMGDLSGRTRSVLVTTPRRAAAGPTSRSGTRRPADGLVGRHAHADHVDLGPRLADDALSRLPRSVCGLCRPGVSITISCASARLTIPRIAWRVVCGSAGGDRDLAR